MKKTIISAAGAGSEGAKKVAKFMKGAVGVCVAASAIALAPCANADDDSFLANLSQHGIFTFKNPQGLVAAGHTICTDLANGVSIQDEVTASSSTTSKPHRRAPRTL
jgi:Protein of unknown function (DUF732)